MRYNNLPFKAGRIMFMVLLFDIISATNKQMDKMDCYILTVDVYKSLVDNPFKTKQDYWFERKGE
jgi:hypothetical protein